MNYALLGREDGKLACMSCHKPWNLLSFTGLPLAWVKTVFRNHSTNIVFEREEAFHAPTFARLRGMERSRQKTLREYEYHKQRAAELKVNALRRVPRSVLVAGILPARFCPLARAALRNRTLECIYGS